MRRDPIALRLKLATCPGLDHNFLLSGAGRSYFIAMRLVPFSLLLLLAARAIGFAAQNPVGNSDQCLVVMAKDWESPTGVLRAFEGTDIPVVLGKKGLGWGAGLVDPRGEGPRKVEGDNKVPAGIFALGPAFGYATAEHARWIKLPYVALTSESEGVDDPHSRYYNQLVERSKVGVVDWHSSEQMRRADDLYKWGIFVAHNPAATPGAGSCIFIHIWRNPSAATVGCTAMAEEKLLGLLRWLDPGFHPILVQMPRSEYDKFQSVYELPDFGGKTTR
jgi:D-alanyl-D-alanine dipeptidase